MINISIIGTILLLHYIGDFLLQSQEMAQKKSYDMSWLMFHVTVYSLVFIIPMLWLIGGKHTALFCWITWGCHACTDYYTSRINAKLWRAKKERQFFKMVGFDQLLHYLQLFITYWILN